jgi:hypothetical protein
MVVDVEVGRAAQMRGLLLPDMLDKVKISEKCEFRF